MSNRMRVRSRNSNARNATSFDGDAQAYFAWAGITDGTVKTAINNLVAGLKAAGLWTAYDVLIPLANQDATAGCFNLIKNDHHASIINGATYTQYEGFTGNGVNMALDIDYNFSTDMVAASLNNHGLSCYVRSERTGAQTPNVYHAMGALADAASGYFTISLTPWSYNNGLNATRNVASAMSAIYGGFNSTVPSTSRGLHQVSRTGTTASELHINGISRSTSAAAGAAMPDSTVGLLCSKLFNGGREGYSVDQVAMAACRRGFSTGEALAETSLFKAYMVELGKDVLP
jgi:hypothetical protein